MSLGFFGSALGSMFFGWLCDKIGCKLPMQICLGMGILGYVIIYASAIWVKSYYLFMLGNVWNNFFGSPGIGLGQVKSCQEGVGPIQQPTKSSKPLSIEHLGWSVLVRIWRPIREAECRA